MIKKIVKTAFLFAIILFITTSSFGTDTADNTITDDVEPISASMDEESAIVDEESIDTPDADTDSEQTQPIEEEIILDEEIYNGDLFIFDSDVEIKKIVDGNVYVFGNNVTISGQIGGNLFVIGNNIKLKQVLVEASAFIIGRDVEFEAIAVDVYTIAYNFKVTEGVGVHRNLNFLGNNLDLYGLVLRDLNFIGNKISFEDTTSNSTIHGEVHGNLNYANNKNLEVVEDYVEGSITYHPLSLNSNEQSSVVYTYIINLLTTLLFTFAVFALIKIFAPDFTEKVDNIIQNKGLVAFLIGLCVLVILPIIIGILFFTVIGVYLGIILLIVYLLLLSITNAVVLIALSDKITKKLKLDKKYIPYLCLLAVSIIVWAFKLIPYIGTILSILFTIFGLGLIIVNLFMKETRFKNDKK